MFFFFQLEVNLVHVFVNSEKNCAWKKFEELKKKKKHKKKKNISNNNLEAVELVFIELVEFKTLPHL